MQSVRQTARDAVGVHLLSRTDRVVVSAFVAPETGPEDRIAVTDMGRGVLDLRMNELDRPAGYTVTQIFLRIIGVTVRFVRPRGLGQHGVVIDTGGLHPGLFRPEQLHRVAFTQVIGRILELRFRTHDDMIGIGAVAVVKDGIVVECLLMRTYDHRVILNLIFTYDDRVITRQGRQDIESNIHRRIASASRGVCMLVPSFGPDCIRILTT